jgi:hypothetical protein
MDPIVELKVRAEILHKRVAEGDAGALLRLRVLAEAKGGEGAALAAIPGSIQRKHCLAVVAREVGFTSWEHARSVLTGDPGATDSGTMLYGGRGFLTTWFTDYAEARAFLDEATRRDERAYLLAFRRQFFVAGSDFVEAVGLDPDDPDWRIIGWDWARPRDRDARNRLYAKRIAALRGQQ